MNLYKKIQLTQVDPELPLPCDVYILINDKYLKFRKKGEALSKEKYEHFIAKSVSSIFTLKDDEQIMLNWLEECRESEVKEILINAGEEHRDFVEASLEMKDKVFEVFAGEKLDSQKIEVIQDNVQEFISIMKKDSILEEAIKAILGRGDDIASHSINVANLATFLAMCLGHGSSFALENIYTAAIFHDYGRAKFPAEILVDKRHPEYQTYMNSHAEESLKMLKEFNGIPEQVFKIILQHHERYDGQGYPNGLSGDDIFFFAQVLSMANEVDNFLTDNKVLGDNIRFERALDFIKSGEGSRWSPSFYPRISEAFYMAFVEKKVTL